MLDTSKYAKLYRELKQELIMLNPGDKVPSVRNIMQNYSVSQATVVKSIDRLHSESLLKKNMGVGTFVTEEILKYKKDAKPVILVALPRWISALGMEVERHFELIQQKYNFVAEFIHYDWRDGILRQIPERKIDGLIIVPAEKLEQQHIAQLAKFQLPFIIFDRSAENLDANSVCSDNQYSGALAADHLIKLGHKQLAIIISEPRFTSVDERINGFLQYCELQNVKTKIIDCQIKSGDRAIEKVYQTMKKSLQTSTPDYTGVFVISEASALGVYKAFYEKGLTIPQDISIIGVDDQDDSDLYFPALTTISTNIDALVDMTVEVLLAKIKATTDSEFTKKKIKSKIIIRESTRKIS